MRIIGGHDYYDCGLSLGIDPTIVLLRGKSRSIPVEKAGGTLLGVHPSTNLYVKNKTQGECIIPVAVVFCEKVYRGTLIPDEWKPGKGTTFEGVWSADKLRGWAEKTKHKLAMAGGPWSLRSHLKLDDYFTPSIISGKLREYMTMSKVSILVEETQRHGEDPCFLVNPATLYQLGFAKAIDPYTAFQELSMWIGGVLGGTSPEIVTIKDDKALIEGHGFDNRFSFRGPRL